MIYTPLVITADIVPQGTVIAAIGELDIASTQQLKTVLFHALCYDEKKTVILDLRETSLIDSAGLGLLIQARRQLAPSDQRFHILLNPGSQPDRALKLTGFDSIVHLIYDLDEIK